MPCKGICIRHKRSRGYATGNKRCNQCNLFIKCMQKEKHMQKAQNKNNSIIIIHAQ